MNQETLNLIEESVIKYEKLLTAKEPPQYEDIISQACPLCAQSFYALPTRRTAPDTK